MIFLLLFSGIYIPLRVAFYDKVHMALLTLEYIFDALFLADIFINFISAYYNGDHIMVTSHCTIAKNYITGWFMIDIVAWYTKRFIHLINLFLVSHSNSLIMIQKTRGSNIHSVYPF